MKMLRLFVLIASVLCVLPAQAQWQTPNHSVPIGRGSGVTGFGSTSPGPAGQALMSNGSTADPTFQAISPSAVLPAPTRKGDIIYWDAGAAAWVTLPGNNSGVRIATEDATGQPAWSTFSSLVKAPKFLRHVNISSVFSIAFDADATLVDIVLVGAGGGGTGNGGNNFIPYYQYGDIGTPTAFDVTPITVSISNATPGIVTTPTHTVPWECNRPFYFSNNGDTLPAPLAFNTVYIIYCGDNPIGANTNQPTATTFGISTRSFNTPITCLLYAPNCQTAIATTTVGSGTHILNMYTFVATAGSGGGVVGDGGLPGTAYGCDSNGPAGYLQSVGHTGGVGGNFYGVNIAPGVGGAGYYGGGGQNASVGTDMTGGGGSGAFPTATASGGGAGGGGGSCHIILKPVPGHLYPLLCGVAGSGGVAATQAATFTNASPTVVTMTGANFPPNAAITFSGGSLPTGVVAGTTYYTLPLDDPGNTYNILNTPYGTAINTSSAGSGTVSSGTAGSRGAYGACEIWTFYGVQ